MERPLRGRDEFREWQERLKRFEASGLSIDALGQAADVIISTTLFTPVHRSLRVRSNLRRRVGPLYV